MACLRLSHKSRPFSDPFQTLCLHHHAHSYRSYASLTLRHKLNSYPPPPLRDTTGGGPEFLTWRANFACLSNWDGMP